MFWCVPGYGFVGLRPRSASGLASPGFSGTRPVKRSMRSRVDCKCVKLNHQTRRGRKCRAGKEVPILARGRRVGAAEVPARTHNVPTLASSPNANTLNDRKRTSRR